MATIEVEVKLREQRPRVVGSANGPEFVVEQTRPALLQEALEPQEVRRVDDVPSLLLRFGSGLVIVREEEERPVSGDGSA